MCDGGESGTRPDMTVQRCHLPTHAWTIYLDPVTPILIPHLGRAPHLSC